MGSDYRVWHGTGWMTMPVPMFNGETLPLVIVSALLYESQEQQRLLLQRRDKPGEVVQGRWELPGGRCRAGEDPIDALVREVAEETGVAVTAVAAAHRRLQVSEHVGFAGSRPLHVVTALEGAYPTMHLVFECYGSGDPVPLSGETTDPTWWPLEGLQAELHARPDEFVWHTRAMLGIALGLGEPPSQKA